MFKALVVLSILAVLAIDAQPIQKLRLRFKLSARDLPDKDDIGLTDPYVEVYYTEGSSSKEKYLTKSGTLSDTINPVWGEIFDFEYDRNKAQRWLFKVKDHDNLREDDTVARGWVIVDDYVDRGQSYTVNLVKKGTLTIQSVDPVAPPNFGASQVVQPQPAAVVVTNPQVPGQQQVVAVQPQRLRFQLSARGLDDHDLIGTTDPYVKAYYTDASTKSESPFGRTAPISDSENPNWTEILEFSYVRGTKQRWHFQVLDQDDNRRDDEVGDAYIDVDEYVSKGETASLKLKKGQLDIRRV